MDSPSFQQNLHLESWVIGGLLRNPELVGDVLDILTEEDFFQTQARAAFRGMSELYQQGSTLDVALLHDHLCVHYPENQIDLALLVEWATGAIGEATSLLAWSKKVHELSITRQAFNQLSAAASKLREKDGTFTRDDTLELLMGELAALQSGQDSAQTQRSMIEALKETLERIDSLFCDAGGTLLGLSSGYEKLDALNHGFQPGQLTLLAARPSMGKTAISLNFLVHAMEYSDDKPAVYFSMEMPTSQLTQRLLAFTGSVDLGKVQTGQLEDADWPKLTAGMNRLSKLKNIQFDEAASLSPAQVRSRLKRYEAKHGPLGLVVVDYLQLMKVPGLEKDPTNEASIISRELKAIAKEFNCPVIALSQLNRSLESRANKRPLPSDLRQSGALEQDADVILFLYRDEVYDEESPDKGIAEIIVAKNRNGELGTVRVGFEGKHQRFYDL